MTTLHLLQALPRARRRAVPEAMLERIATLPMAAVSRLRRAVREREDTMLLLRMRERDLHDIGLSEGDLAFLEARDTTGERRR